MLPNFANLTLDNRVGFLTMGALYKGIAFGFKFDKKRLLDIPFDEYDTTVEDVLYS